MPPILGRAAITLGIGPHSSCSDCSRLLQTVADSIQSARRDQTQLFRRLRVDDVNWALVWSLYCVTAYRQLVLCLDIYLPTGKYTLGPPVFTYCPRQCELQTNRFGTLHNSPRIFTYQVEALGLVCLCVCVCVINDFERNDLGSRYLAC